MSWADPLEDLRVLTGHRVWFWSMVYLDKWVENRRTQHDFMAGRWVALHAGQTIAAAPIGLDRYRAAVLDAGWSIRETPLGTRFQKGIWIVDQPPLADLPTGIIGMAQIGAVRTDSQRLWSMEGCVHYELDHLVALPSPIPWKGGLGWRRLPVEIIEQIRPHCPAWHRPAGEVAPASQLALF